ncbi:hypothetical protein FB451DRAFT_1418873 [Mycena latifolia]|nr:hypothetical protein FB451DRAFT_1418873 [Mycena latifolia]
MSSTNWAAYWPRLTFPSLPRLFPLPRGPVCGAHARDLGTAANIALDVITSIDQVVGDLPPQAVCPSLGLRFRLPAHHAICISVSVFISGYLVIHGTRFALPLVAHLLILFFLLFYMAWFDGATADVSISLEFRQLIQTSAFNQSSAKDTWNGPEVRRNSGNYSDLTCEMPQ